MTMKFSDKILVLPIVLLLANFLFRLVNFSTILYRFPLDVTNDLTAYIADIPFFEMYGYFGHVTQWYNGFTLFNIYPPGWVFFTYPLYKLFGNLMLAVFISTLLLFFFGFLITWFFGKELNISVMKRIALFTFIYANPMIVGAVLKQGRIPSLMALDLLLLFFFLCVYFKERQFTWKAISLPLVYAALILTHQTETVLASAFLLGLFLVKPWREKIQLFILMLLSILFSSFWLFHFLKAVFETGFLQYGFGNWLLDWHSYFWNNLAGIVISVGLFVLFYIFYKQKQDQKWFYFFVPILILNISYLTRLSLLIPLIKNIYPDPWQDFLVINVCVLFVALNYNLFPKKWKIILAVGMILIAGASVCYNMFHTPYMMDWNTEGQEAIALVPYLDQDSHFLMFSEYSKELYSRAIYSYAAIYYNTSSASGWFEVNKEYTYVLELNNLYKEYLNTESCESMHELNTQFNTTEILANGHYCEAIKGCGLKIKEVNGSSCILLFTS